MAKVKNDARLWATMIPTLQGAGVFHAETVARVLVAAVRRERDPKAQTWAPGDQIPLYVTAVYDLDGDVWNRCSTDLADPLRDSWKMRGHDPAEHESRSGGVHLTPGLLDEYGPLTEIK